MAQRKSSILKPRKAREPLQDLNQLLPNNDDEETTTTTGFGKRRVSFASMNKVKEFESAAECYTLLNTPAYDERFSISSDSCQSSVLGSTHAESLKLALKENTARDDLAGEEEIELTETIGGKILESSMKSRGDCSMEFTTPYSAMPKLPDSILQYEITNQNKSDFDTSCMETTDVITNNLFSETVGSQLCADSKYDEREIISECENMEISPYREMMPLSRKSIFHPDQSIPARKSIFDLPPSQPPEFDFIDKAKNVRPTEITNDESVFMDVSIPIGGEIVENVSLETSTNMTLENANSKPRKSIFSKSFDASNVEKPLCELWNADSERINLLPAYPIVGERRHNSSLPVTSQTSRYESAMHNSSLQPMSNRTEYHNSSMQFVSQPIEPNNEAPVFCRASQFGPAAHNSSVQPLSNRTEYLDSSMQLVSQTIEPNNEGPVFSQVSQVESASRNSNLPPLNNQTEYQNTSMQLVSQPIDRTEYPNSSMQFMSQPIEPNNDEELIGMDNSRTRFLSEKINKTNCNATNMQLASQEMNAITESRIDNKTRHDHSDMQLVSQEINAVVENKTRFDSTNMQLASQENHTIAESRIDKTRFNNSNMQLASQETNRSQIDGGTCFDDSNVHLADRETNAMTESKISDKTHSENPAEDICSTSLIGPDKVEGETLQTVNVEASKTLFDISMPPLASEILDDGVTIEGSAQNEANNEDEFVACDKLEMSNEKHDENDVKSEIQKSYSENSSSYTNSDSNSPLTVGVNFSIFQKNKETRVEFSGTIDSNRKERSKSISNVQVNIINNKAKKENQNVQKLRFSMPATESNYEETKPRVYASFVDVKLPREKGVSSRTSTRDIQDLEPVQLMSPVLENDSIAAVEEREHSLGENREQTFTKKRLSSEMLMGEDEEDNTTTKRRSISTARTCESVQEMTMNHEQNIVASENVIHQVENVDVRQVCTSTQVTQRRASVVYEDQSSSSVIALEKVIVETCSRMETLTCTTSKNSLVQTDLNNTRAQLAQSLNESRNIVEDPPENNELDPLASQSDEQNKTGELPSDDNNSGNQTSNEQELEAGLPDVCDRETAVEGTSERKSLAVDDLSSDNEPIMKDRSPELVSDNDTNRWSTQVHGTPCRKRSTKSLGGLSGLEDNSLDVNVGDSFYHRSSDVCPVNVSAPDLRDYSNLEEGKNIENIPSVNVSKVSFVSDWLQNKTGKPEIASVEKLTNLVDNQSSSSTGSNKILSSDKSVSAPENSSNEFNSVRNQSSENLGENLKDQSNEVKKSDSLVDVRIESVAVTETSPSEEIVNENANVIHPASPCASNPVNIDVSTHLIVDRELTVNETHVRSEEDTPAQSTEDNKNSPQVPDLEAVTNDVVPVSIDVATLDQSKTNNEMEIDTCDLNNSNALPAQEPATNPSETGITAQLSISSREVAIETISDDFVENVNEDDIQQTSQIADVVNNVEPFVEHEEIRSDENLYCETDGVDQDEEIDHLDLIHTSVHDGNLTMEMSMHEISTREPSKNEAAIANVKEEILEKIREEHSSGHSSWRLISVSCEEWIIKYSDRGHLVLVVIVEPGTLNCSAAFKFVREVPDKYREVMGIGLRALRRNCQKKMETICRTVEDLPFLLKSVTTDVEWMKNFVQDLHDIAGLEDVRFKNGRAKFSIASYKNLTLFDVLIPLNNLRTLSVDDINVDVKFGKVDINSVRRMFSESGRDYNFMSRFVDELIRTFGR